MFSRWSGAVWQDFRQAFRLIRCQPLFSLGAILVLALGVGLVTSLLTFLNAEIFRPWQVQDPNSMTLIRARPTGRDVSGDITIAEYRYLREHSRTISQMAAMSSPYPRDSRIDDGAGRSFEVPTSLVNADYFNALKVGMTVGPGFLNEDEDYGAPRAVAIISERLWRQRFASDPGLIGRTLVIDKQVVRVVGVSARGFSDPERGSSRTDLWRPLPTLALTAASLRNLAQFADPAGPILHLAGRLNAGVTRTEAAAELSVLSRQFRSAASLPSNGIVVFDTRPVSLWGGFLPGTLPLYALFLLAVFLVLLLACANVGNLLLARALSRQREIAIRLSLGAGRVRLVRQLLMEAALLSAVAGSLGLGLAFIVPSLLLNIGFRFTPLGFVRVAGSPDAIRAAFYSPDARVFGLAIVVVVLTTVLVGLAPTLRATRVTTSSLSVERHGRTVESARLRLALLATQIALTTLLLTGAGLLTRAIGHAASLDPGFAIKDIQTISVKLPLPPGPPDLARWKAFFADLRDTLRDTDLGPIAFSALPPLSDVRYVMVAHRPDEEDGVFHFILLRPVSPNYFAVLGIPIVKGRVPASEADARELVVSEAAAHALWPGADPIGKTLQSALTKNTFETCEVVGVAKDVPVRSMSEIEPVIYRPSTSPSATLLLRSTSSDTVERVRAIAIGLDPHVTVSGRPFVEYVRDSLTTAVLAARVAWAIGGLGLMLAMVGAFGVFAFAVEERRREIGIRMALGARARQVVLLVLLTAKSAVVLGLGVGFVLTFAATPLFRHYLYGLSPIDPVAYVEVAGILIVTAGLATWIPARRAVMVDPITTLRRD